MKIRCSFGWHMLLLVAWSATTACAADDLAKAQTVYAGQLQGIRQAADTAKTEALAAYRRNLEVLRQQTKQKGDLDALQALDAEIKRFDQQKAPPATPVGEDLSKAATACRDALEQAEVDRARNVVQLTEKYLSFLDQRVKQAVRDDRLDIAKTFKTEMDTVKETADYQAAKFVLAEKQTQSAAPPAATAAPLTPTSTPAAAAAAHPAAEHLRMRTDPDGLYDAARITDGVAASLSSSSPYRPLLASETGKAPQAGGLIGITLDGDLDNNASRYQLRIKLRLKTSGEPVQNLKLLVQYFVRTGNGGSLQEARLQFAPVASVGAKNTICEMKPVELSGNNNIFRVRGETIVMGGREGPFAGVVVSAFSADDKLLTQVTSFPALKDKGRATFDVPPQWQEHTMDPETVREMVIRYRSRRGDVEATLPQGPRP